MAGSYAALYYHLVFSTKDRQRLITPDLAPRLYDYMGGIIRSAKGIALRIGGHDDHLHILAVLDKNRTVPDAVRDIKSNSARWIHETFPKLRGFAWQEGYGVFTISVTGLDRVQAYIDRQAEHHRTQTFQEEFIAFLEQHGCAYDPELIWR